MRTHRWPYGPSSFQIRTVALFSRIFQFEPVLYIVIVIIIVMAIVICIVIVIVNVFVIVIVIIVMNDLLFVNDDR